MAGKNCANLTWCKIWGSLASFSTKICTKSAKFRWVSSLKTQIRRKCAKFRWAVSGLGRSGRHKFAPESPPVHTFQTFQTGKSAEIFQNSILGPRFTQKGHRTIRPHRPSRAPALMLNTDLFHQNCRILNRKWLEDQAATWCCPSYLQLHWTPFTEPGSAGQPGV